MNKTKENTVPNENEKCKSICRIARLVWNAGFQFIPILLATSIILSFMYHCDNGYHLVKNGHSVAIDSVMIISSDRDTTIVALTNSLRQDSVIARVLTQQVPQDESQGSYLSLWAAALAVIFVVFSIFGVLKLEFTKGEIEKKFNDIKEIEEKGKTRVKELEDLSKQSQDVAKRSKYELDELNKKSQEEINELVESSKKKSEEKFNELVELSKKAQDYSSLIHRMSIHFIASMNDNIFTRKRRIEEVDQIMHNLKSLDLNIDNYELLYGIFSMYHIKGCQEEEVDRMNLIIKLLNRDRLTKEKLILLGKSYYRLYSCIDSAYSNKQDYLKKSIIYYISILPSEREGILSILPIDKAEIINSISNEYNPHSTADVEIKDIQFELCRALYDYALNYSDDNLKQLVLRKASSILETITK